MVPPSSLFVGDVPLRPGLVQTGPAERAIHAVVTTLGERLPGRVARDLAAAVPDEISVDLRRPKSGQWFDLPEFLSRVAAREGVEQHQALEHSQIVVGLLWTVASPEHVERVRDSLGQGFAPLFEVVDRYQPTGLGPQ